MPGGDGTGPLGQGPMTGRAAGFCAGNSVAGFANSMPRRGMGFGRGRGMGRRSGGGRGFGLRFWDRPQKPPKEQEQQSVENQLKSLEEEQNALNEERESLKKRLEELRK